VIAPALAFAALAWLALLIATPIGPTSLATLMYSVGAFICHQIPDRSFHLGGFQIPVCARCLGIYAGFALGACVQVLASSRASSIRWRLTPASARRVFAAGALPTAATLALEWSGVWRGSNIVRAIAGSALGIGVALVVMGVAATLHYNACERRRPIEPSQLPPPI
jgi:uncharacterized membrane protein